jgi:hypothetical protein
VTANDVKTLVDRWNVSADMCRSKGHMAEAVVWALAAIELRVLAKASDEALAACDRGQAALCGECGFLLSKHPAQCVYQGTAEQRARGQVAP